MKIGLTESSFFEKSKKWATLRLCIDGEFIKHLSRKDAYILRNKLNEKLDK